MSIDGMVDVDPSDIAGNPVRRPQEFDSLETEVLERTKGVYQSTNDTDGRGVEKEVLEKSRSYRKASILFTGVLGTVALADATGMADPSSTFYTVNTAAAILSELRSQTERKLSKIVFGLNEIKEKTEYINSRVEGFEERTRATRQKINLSKAAIDGVRVRSYDAPQSDHDRKYLQP